MSGPFVGDWASPVSSSWKVGKATLHGSDLWCFINFVSTSKRETVDSFEKYVSTLSKLLNSTKYTTSNLPHHNIHNSCWFWNHIGIWLGINSLQWVYVSTFSGKSQCWLTVKVVNSSDSSVTPQREHVIDSSWGELLNLLGDNMLRRSTAAMLPSTMKESNIFPMKRWNNILGKKQEKTSSLNTMLWSCSKVSPQELWQSIASVLYTCFEQQVEDKDRNSA